MNQRRPESTEYAAWYAGYVARVREIDVVTALETQAAGTAALLRSISEDQSLFRYGPDKWSIRQVVGHLGDAERVFGYRALAISRGESQPLPGFDENAYVKSAPFDENWTLAELADSLTTARRASIFVYRHLPDEAWDRVGTANKNPISVRGLAYATVGHERHHVAILRERYLGAPAT